MKERQLYPPSQKISGVSPGMSGSGGSSEARREKTGASADSAEEIKDVMGVSLRRLHLTLVIVSGLGIVLTGLLVYRATKFSNYSPRLKDGSIATTAAELEQSPTTASSKFQKLIK